jgi:hypothetical protein
VAEFALRRTRTTSPTASSVSATRRTAPRTSSSTISRRCTEHGRPTKPFRAAATSCRSRGVTGLADRTWTSSAERPHACAASATRSGTREPLSACDIPHRKSHTERVQARATRQRARSGKSSRRRRAEPYERGPAGPAGPRSAAAAGRAAGRPATSPTVRSPPAPVRSSPSSAPPGRPATTSASCAVTGATPSTPSSPRCCGWVWTPSTPTTSTARRRPREWRRRSGMSELVTDGKVRHLDLSEELRGPVASRPRRAPDRGAAGRILTLARTRKRWCRSCGSSVGHDGLLPARPGFLTGTVDREAPGAIDYRAHNPHVRGKAGRSTRRSPTASDRSPDYWACRRRRSRWRGCTNRARASASPSSRSRGPSTSAGLSTTVAPLDEQAFATRSAHRSPTRARYERSGRTAALRSRQHGGAGRAGRRRACRPAWPAPPGRRRRRC